MTRRKPGLICLLSRLYWDEGRTLKEIAEEYGISATAVMGLMKRHHIPRRSTSEAARKRKSWKGGKVGHDGYIYVLNPTHPHANAKGYVYEHRLVMEQKLGRYLLPSEKVHHINGIRDDNRPDNLQLLSPSDHSLQDSICRNCQLRKDIRLLRWQIKELQKQLQGRLLIDEIGAAE